jgi:hypothetical protein
MIDLSNFFLGFLFDLGFMWLVCSMLQMTYGACGLVHLEIGLL